jgi:hypothetical protein
VPITRKYLAAKLAALRAQHAHAGDFCFFTDIENLPAIFQAGQLLCRSSVLKQGLLRLDCASQDVLNKTPGWVHDHVRLYFAPGTPMLYQIEGIKRQPDKWPECPRPAYLVFDPAMLTLPGVKVSDGNMGSKYSDAQDGSDAFFDSLPFDDIFHRGVVQKDPNAEAIYGFDPRALDKFRRRQAEVLVPQTLPLSHLVRMVFRSQAERDLALGDIGGAPRGVQIDVDRSWFFAQSRGRPHLDTFVAGPGGTFSVANVADGDTVVQLRRPRSGSPSAHATTFRQTAWQKWKELDSGKLPVPLPRRGRVVFYLHGHRVAEEDA